MTASVSPEVIECDHDWEDIGNGQQQCTYPDCQVITPIYTINFNPPHGD